MTQRPLVAAVAVSAAVLWSGCESTQTRSARLAKAGAGRAELVSLDLARKANPDVKVGKPVILRGDGVNAVVVELENTGRTVQAGVPVALEALGKDGRPVYKNDLDGLQVALQQMAALRPGETAFWVDDQVVAPEPVAAARVEVGAPAAPAPAEAATKLPLEDVELQDDVTGAYLGGKVHNPTKATLRNVPIYAVARRGGEVVAAGRAIVQRLDPDPVKKPAVFRVYFVGTPRGAKLDVRAYPPPPVPAEETPAP